MITIVELQPYKESQKKLLSELENERLINFLAGFPLSGTVLQNTGGLRKIRWGFKKQGKRSGVRIIYYYHNETMPLFLLFMYAKNQKESLSAKEAVKLKVLVNRLKNIYGK